jgi:hypothetical protein
MINGNGRVNLFVLNSVKKNNQVSLPFPVVKKMLSLVLVLVCELSFNSALNITQSFFSNAAKHATGEDNMQAHPIFQEICEGRWSTPRFRTHKCDSIML